MCLPRGGIHTRRTLEELVSYIFGNNAGSVRVINSMKTNNSAVNPRRVVSKTRPVGRPARLSQQSRYAVGMTEIVKEPPLLRVELGEVLRGLRLAQSKTLREVSSEAQVSLGYLSEVERGQKEASSELLQSICQALGTPLWTVLQEVADRLSLFDDTVVPDTVPDDLLHVGVMS